MIPIRLIASAILIFVSFLTGCVSKNTVIDSVKNKTQQQSQQKSKTQESKSQESKPQGRLSGSVLQTVDGDTIEVLIDGIKEKVRLLGINAPSNTNSESPPECFGFQAAQQINLLLKNKIVYLEADRFAPNRDQYGQFLRYVYDENKQMINLEMVKNGYAFAYTPGALEHFSDFRYYEKQARDSNIGLWNSAVCPYNSKR